MLRYHRPIQLHRIAALQHLEDSVLSAMSAAATVYCLKPGEVLLYHHDLIHAFYVIQEGGVRLVDYTAEGQKVTLKIYGPGDVFGLLAISGSYPHPTQIESIMETMIIAVDGQDVRRLMLEYPQLALTVIDLLTAHVHDAHHRIRHMAAERVDQRLARALLHLAKKFGQDFGSSISLELPVSQRDLAEYVGTTVETINRTLTLWSKQGMVECSHKHIDLLNVEALKAIAENQMTVQSKRA